MLAELLHALAHFYEARAGTDEIPMLDTVAEVLIGITEGESPTAPEPGPLPVVRLLEGVDPGSDGLLAAFLSVAPDLPWTQTRAYVDSLPAEFLDNYGYVRLVGSAGVVHSERASIGIGVWGAGLRYPPHVHPAEETYHVLAGSSAAPTVCIGLSDPAMSPTTGRRSRTNCGSGTGPVWWPGRGRARSVWTPAWWVDQARSA